MREKSNMPKTAEFEGVKQPGVVSPTAAPTRAPGACWALLPGWPVAKKNRRRAGGRSPSAEYGDWHGRALQELAKYWPVSRAPLQGPCKVVLRFWVDHWGRRDLDNSATSVLDTLVDFGVLQDDSLEVVRELAIEARHLQDHPEAPALGGECVELLVLEV